MSLGFQNVVERRVTFKGCLPTGYLPVLHCAFNIISNMATERKN